jgi:bla regulator protein blaR1
VLQAYWTQALANHVWQSTAIAVAAWLLTLALRKNQAHTRYWIWLAASAKFLLPFSLLVTTGRYIGSSIAKPISQPAISTLMERITRPVPATAPIVAAVPAVVKHNGHMLLIFIFSLWLCGFIAVAASWIRGWRRLSSAVRSSSPWPLVTDVPVLSCPSLIEPGIVGIVSPVLLLPEGISGRLTPDQLDAVVAHEICHVRRRDNLTFAIHMVVETLFWFHPLVWWIRTHLVEERERACDEAVLQSGHKGEVYAEGILNVGKFYVEPPLACASVLSGTSLKKRITRIMSQPSGVRLTLAGKMLLAASGFVTLAAPVGLGLLFALPISGQLLRTTSTPVPSFEVATIKPSKDVGVQIMMSAAAFRMKGSLKDLIEYGYDMRSDEQLVGGPSWMNTEFFEVRAKATEADIKAINKLYWQKQIDQTRLMVQSLLADRFQMKASIQNQEREVYALEVAKGGPKFKEVELSPFPPPGTAPAPGAHLPKLGWTGPSTVSATAWPMNEMPFFLSSNFPEIGNHLVIDQTGLKGNYDFVLNGVSRPLRQPADPTAAPPEGAATTSIFTALQEQLGLKLELRKAQVEVLVIENVERPSEN